MFCEIGERCYIEPPFHANWAGKFVHFGNDFYVNYNLMVADDTDIYVGDHTMIGPNVTLAVAGHPIEPNLRKQGYQYNMAIHIGKNCWLGAGVIVLPGVHIGDNRVIGSSSVVPKDIPSNAVALGNSCCILHEINEKGKEYYFKNHKINLEK